MLGTRNGGDPAATPTYRVFGDDADAHSASGDLSNSNVTSRIDCKKPNAGELRVKKRAAIIKRPGKGAGDTRNRASGEIDAAHDAPRRRLCRV